MKITPKRGPDSSLKKTQPDRRATPNRWCQAARVRPCQVKTNRSGDRDLARVPRATSHDRAKEESEARADRAIQHARAMPASLRLRGVLEKRILCNFWGDHSFLGFVRYQFFFFSLELMRTLKLSINENEWFLNSNWILIACLSLYTINILLCFS